MRSKNALLAQYNYDAGEIKEGHKYLIRCLECICEELQ